MINIVNQVWITSVMVQLLIELLVILEIKLNSDFRWSVLHANIDGFNNLRIVKSIIQLMGHNFPRRFNHINLTEITGKTWALFQNFEVSILSQALSWRWSRSHVDKLLSGGVGFKLTFCLLSYKFLNLHFVSLPLFWGSFGCRHCF